MSAPVLDEHDVEEMERLAKRMLALCAKVRADIDRPIPQRLKPSTLSAERKAELIAQMHKRLRRQGVDDE